MDPVALIKGLTVLETLLQATALTAESFQTVSDIMKKAHAENRDFTAEENAVLDGMVDAALADNQAAIDEYKAKLAAGTGG